MTVLSADSLSVRTADGTRLVRDVSLALDHGETVVVSGPPGSGKTLLTKALKGLLDGHDDLVVDGHVHRAGTVGYVFQSPRTQLVRQTVAHDVAFGLENRAVPVSEIEARIDRYAGILDAEHLLDRSVRALSGGEATKVAILGVLVTEPDVVILDEPIAPLDAPNTRLVLDAVDRLRDRGTAVLVTEHDLRTLLRRADRALLLEDGRVTERGPPADLLRALSAAGVTLPFATEVALALAGDDPAASVPIPNDEPEVERP